MPLHRDFELPRQMLKIHPQGGPEHLPVFLSVRHQRGAQTRMREHPIQIQGQADRRHAKLTALQDREKMNVLFQPTRNLIHHIRLRAQQLVQPLQALLLRLNLQLRAKLIKLLEVKLHHVSP